MPPNLRLVWEIRAIRTCIRKLQDVSMNHSYRKAKEVRNTFKQYLLLRHSIVTFAVMRCTSRLISLDHTVKFRHLISDSHITRVSPV